MDNIRQYIISVVSAAMICGILRSIFSGKGAVEALVKLVSSIFLAFVIIRPVTQIDLDPAGFFPDILSQKGQQAAVQGENLSREALSAIITGETEAYILDKAEELNLQLMVAVTLSDDPLPVPISVRLEGEVSPYAKASLMQTIEQELGIPKEDQQWIT